MNQFPFQIQLVVNKPTTGGILIKLNKFGFFFNIFVNSFFKSSSLSLKNDLNFLFQKI